MSLKDEAYPSSAAFDAIADALKDEKDRKDAVKRANIVFAFELKNDQGATKTWYIDLKETGKVLDKLPEGKKAGVTFKLSDQNFAKLVSGSANAQKLFMSGKLKIGGDPMKAMKLEPILKKAQTKAKL